MNAVNGSNTQQMSSKRPLEYPDQYAAKRAQPQPAQELDLEAIVAEINQHTQQSGTNASYNDSSSLEKQIEGALASLNAQSADPAPGLALPTSHYQPYGQSHPQLHAPAVGLQPQALEFPAHSSEYEAQLQAQLESSVSAPARASVDSAYIEVCKRCLPILDSLACQILEYLSSGHYQEVLTIVTQPQTEKGKAFKSIVEIFEQTKKMYLDSDGAFIPLRAEFRDSRIAIQRANLASWSAAVFGVIEIGFYDLDQWFLRAFVPEKQRLLKSQTSIYLELKTQAYISSLSQTQKSPEAVLEDLFPKEMAKSLLASRSDRQALNNSELDFVTRCAKRRENIEGQTNQVELAKNYQWVFFLRDLSEYLAKHHYTLLPHPAQQLRQAQLQKRQQQEELEIAQKNKTKEEKAYTADPQKKSSSPESAKSASEGPREPSQSNLSPQAQLQPQSESQSQPELHQQQPSSGDAAPESRGSAAPAVASPSLTAQATASPAAAVSASPAAATSPAVDSPGGAIGQSPQTRPKSKSKHTRREWGEEAKRRVAEEGKLSNDNTHAIYEAAKLTSEGVENSRPARNSMLTRRSWTNEEVEALLKGLDKVQGPYWSQILELYGAGGSISEALKDRTQVQLKDKARNLKMFFERCGMPTPAVFQYVTGSYENRKGGSRRSKTRKGGTMPNTPNTPGMPVQAGRSQSMHMGQVGQVPVQRRGQGEDDVQQSAEALEKALSLLKGGTDDNFDHLIQKVGDYMNINQ